MADNCLRKDVNRGKRIPKGRDLAMDCELPDEIKQLVGRCEIRESFDNDDMSLALKYAELLHKRFVRLAEFYEKQSGNFMPEDIRANCCADSAKLIRSVLKDCKADL